MVCMAVTTHSHPPLPSTASAAVLTLLSADVRLLTQLTSCNTLATHNLPFPVSREFSPENSRETGMKNYRESRAPGKRDSREWTH